MPVHLVARLLMLLSIAGCRAAATSEPDSVPAAAMPRADVVSEAVAPPPAPSKVSESDAAELEPNRIAHVDRSGPDAHLSRGPGPNAEAVAVACYPGLMSDAARSVPYPRIARHAGICGGQPVVAGTRIPVATIVRSQQLGMDFDEILLQYPTLQAADLHAAILYYLDHRAEIDALLRDAEDPIEGAVIVR